MTENMAGRGEGLAGLVTKWRKDSQMTPIGDATNLVYRTLGACADELETALEAAAPAGTPDTSREALEAAEYALSHPESNQRFALVAVRAALATPSPQAPQEQCNAFSTTSAREQSSATASDNQGVAIFREVLRLHSSWVHFPEDGHLECVCRETICKKFRIHHRETVDAWLDHVMPLLLPGGAA